VNEVRELVNGFVWSILFASNYLLNFWFRSFKNRSASELILFMRGVTIMFLSKAEAEAEAHI